LSGDITRQSVLQPTISACPNAQNHAQRLATLAVTA
jgi:hypothetical protein